MFAGALAGIPEAARGMNVTTWPSTAAEMPRTVPVTTPFESVSICCTYLEATPPSQPQLLADGALTPVG